mgnify:CR=1 FL=1
MVITDYGPQAELDPMLRAENDFYLTAFNGVKGMSITDMFKDSSSITALHSIRKAIKNICYTEVNSGIYNKIAPNAKSYRERATWDTVINYVMVPILYTASCLFVALIIASIIINHIWEKKHTETTNSQN